MKLFHVLCCSILVAGVATFVDAAPQPGDIFREYVYNTGGEADGFHRITALDVSNSGDQNPESFLPNDTQTISIGDLTDAVRAEVQVELIQGHRGTYGQKITFNGNSYVYIPGPTNIPPKEAGVTGSGYSELHQTTRYPCADVPLGHLQTGNNTFKIDADGQYATYYLDNGWGSWTNWGQSLWYAVIVRVYYASNKPHATGAITSPTAGGSVGENPAITASTVGSVSKVDFLGNYYGINWEGDNVYKQWKYIFRDGSISKHIGTDSTAPYSVTWDTTWVPNQTETMSFCARVHDTSGVIYMTPAVDNVAQSRTTRSVIMYTNYWIPEGMQVRNSYDERYLAKCNFMCDKPMTNALSAKAFYVSWSAGYMDSLKLNGYTVQGGHGNTYSFGFEEFSVNPSYISQGDNLWNFFAETAEHGIEVNWPGPTLLVEFDEAPAVDDESPTQPAGLYVSETNETSVVLNWTASTDNVGVSGYCIFRDGSQIDTTANTGYTAGGLASSTTYAFAVCAYDAAGNRSTTTSVLNVTTKAEVPQVDRPVFSPNGGVFTNSVQVSISCGTSGADVYYTLDGSEPTQSSTLYSSPFTLTTTTTVRARGFKSGVEDSDIHAAIFSKAGTGGGSAPTARPTWAHYSSATGIDTIPDPAGATEQTMSHVGDFNDDGRDDFVIGSRNSGAKIELWISNSDTTWTKYLIDNRTDTRPEAGGAVADVDGDGDLDLVVGQDSGGFNIYWFENPSPTFSTTTSWNRYQITTGGKQYHDMMFYDVDQDADLEFIFWNQVRDGNPAKLYVAEIPADPKATSSWTKTLLYTGIDYTHEGLDVADIDLDGKPDIAGSGYWFKNNGGVDTAISFTANQIVSNRRWTRTQIADIVEGGRPEVIICNGDQAGTMDYYEWNGSGWTANFIANVGGGHSLRVADIDQDGHLDIFNGEMDLFETQGGLSWIWYGDGTGSFSNEIISTGIDHHESRLADLNGDGALDILGKPFNGGTPRVDVWMSSGVSAGGVISLTNWTTHLIDGAVANVCLQIEGVDLDGDGDKDIVSGQHWWENPGDLSGSWSMHTPGSSFNQFSASYDFDGDGDIDLVGTEGTGISSSHAFRYARNDGSGNFDIRSIGSVSDGDFLQGVLVDELQGGETVVALSWHANSAGIHKLTVPADPWNDSWTAGVLSSTSLKEDLAQGDIDGDGDLDLALGTIWLENTGSGWTSHTLGQVSDLSGTGGTPEPDRVDLADFDGDGDLDIMSALEYGQDVVVFENPKPGGSVTGTWTRHIIGQSPGQGFSADTRDLDNDGDPDIIVGEHRGNLQSPSVNKVIIYENDGTWGTWPTHIVDNQSHTTIDHHDGTQCYDMDGDGDLDILSIGFNNKKVWLFENTAPVAVYGDTPTVATPVISPNGGDFSGSVNVTITSDAGAEIFYTTDGSTPTTNSTLYTGTLTIDSSLTLKAFAILAGANDSAVATAEFDQTTLQSPWVDDTIGSVPEGNAHYAAGVFTCGGAGKIDSTGTADSFHFIHQLLTGDGEIIAHVTGIDASDAAARAGVMIREQLTVGSKHAFIATENGASRNAAWRRRVTTDGNNAHTSGPVGDDDRWVRLVRSGNSFSAYVKNNEGDSWTQAGSSVSITMSNTVHIGLVVMANSLTVIGTGTFESVSVSGGVAVATPSIAPSGGTFSGIVTVSLSCATSGADIRYTTDGNDPTTNATLYSTPFTLSASATVKAQAFKDGMADSSVASATFTKDLPTVATPLIAPAAGSYSGAVTVSVTCATSGAEIYYTTDGSTPDETDSLYSSPIVSASSFTVKAIGIKSGMNDSAVASASYTVTPIGGSQDGVWLEAEDGVIVSPFVIFTGEVDTANGRYVSTVNNTGANLAAGDASAGKVTVSFDMSVEAPVYIWGRVIGAGNTDDSFHLRLNDGGYLTWDIVETTTWQWEKIYDGTTLAVGSHSLEVSQREDGAKVDKFLVTTNASYTPEGQGGSSAQDPDSDSDGIPDSWEMQHFGNLTTADGSSDQDGDGMLDKYEYISGTVPTNGASLLQVESVLETALEGNRVISWISGGTGINYTVMWSTNLLSEMQMLSVIPGGEDELPLAVTDAVHQAAQRIYYRLKAERQ